MKRNMDELTKEYFPKTIAEAERLKNEYGSEDEEEINEKGQKKISISIQKQDQKVDRSDNSSDGSSMSIVSSERPPRNETAREIEKELD